MSSRSRVRLRLLALLLPVAGISLLASGCFNPFSPKKDDDVPPTPVAFNRLTPEALINEFFPGAYENRDSVRYDEMLDDHYEFVFLEVDRGDADLPEGEDSWGRTQELRSAGNLFRADNVTDILLDLTPISKIADNTVFDDKPEEELWYKLRTETDLRVTVLDESQDGWTTFLVANQQEFIVRPDPRPEHAGKWLIRQQREIDAPGR